MPRSIFARIVFVAACWSSMLLGRLVAADEQNNQDPAQPAAADRDATNEERIQQALDAKTSIELLETPLGDFVQQLRQRTQANVLVDQRALDDVGLSQDVPLTHVYRDISLRSILNLILRNLDLTWMVEDGALVITTNEEAELRLTTKVYNVTDLVAMDDEPESYDHDSLIQAITAVVQPESWNDVGGPASIETYRGTIAISQTQAVHREISALLEALRKGQQMAMADPPTPPSQTAIRLTNDTEDAIFAALKKPISLDVEETPLVKFGETAQQQWGVQMAIDVRALDDVGLAADTPVTLTVENLPAGQALSHLLRPLDLTWRVTDEILLITTPEEAETALEIRVYPVRDLYGSRKNDDDLFPTHAADADDLIQAIANTIDTNTWNALGGPGAIEELPGAGVVVASQTAHVHSRIERLLTRLRTRLAEKREPPAAAASPDANTLKLVIYPIPVLLNVAAPAQPQREPREQEQGKSGNGDAQRQCASEDVLGQFGGAGFGGGGFGLGVESTPIPGDALVEIVTALVEPESWNREGVYIKAVPGRLIVRQTEAVHRNIGVLLERLGVSGFYGEPGSHGGFF